MSDTRETWVALSALQHLLFCERQAALIHVEQLWREDVNTALGRLLHERVDLPGHDARPGRRVARAVRLGCSRLRLTGRADLCWCGLRRRFALFEITNSLQRLRGLGSRRLGLGDSSGARFARSGWIPLEFW
ncbi:Dna2/Cas4 domain-containing protein [Myxococcus sp. CA040A]|uniref:CRISPR-associated protein Cas4 n=1 Tax=Myxococcus sp. CA040A TaxID=2741738 RepID=UPI0020C5F009|nr:Dna2/Cas4 domain-containing protein [Myxococcus sp. CA040A]